MFMEPRREDNVSVFQKRGPVAKHCQVTDENPVGLWTVSWIPKHNNALHHEGKLRNKGRLNQATTQQHVRCGVTVVCQQIKRLKLLNPRHKQQLAKAADLGDDVNKSCRADFCCKYFSYKFSFFVQQIKQKLLPYVFTKTPLSLCLMLVFTSLTQAVWTVNRGWHWAWSGPAPHFLLWTISLSILPQIHSWLMKVRPPLATEFLHKDYWSILRGRSICAIIQ